MSIMFQSQTLDIITIGIQSMIVSFKQAFVSAQDERESLSPYSLSNRLQGSVKVTTRVQFNV